MPCMGVKSLKSIILEIVDSRFREKTKKGKANDEKKERNDEIGKGIDEKRLLK